MVNSGNLYLAIDADNAGRMVGRAVLANDIPGLTEVSSRIDMGQEIIADWVTAQGGKKISGGGDEFTAEIPSGSLEQLEQLRSDYQFATQLTITVGVGSNLAEAGKSLMAGKFRGKDQVVQYDPSVDSDLVAAQGRVVEGTGSEEENKLNEAYLKEGSTDHSDCKYCAQSDEASHSDNCQYCQAHEAAQSSNEDCKYCVDESANTSSQIPDHSHTDDCAYCAAKEQVDNHEHSEDDCDYCINAEQRAADTDHDHTDDCQYCASKDSPEGQATGEALASAIMVDDPNSQSERDAVNAIDDTQMPISTESEDGVSHPDGYDGEAAPSDMGLSEDSPESQNSGLTDVLQSGLNAHAESINKEKIVSMVSQALEGFKANKQILEKAKDRAPDLYTSTIAMLKAMIEMAKQLGLGTEVGQEEQSTGSAQSAAPQEGAAQTPQQ